MQVGNLDAVVAAWQKYNDILTANAALSDNSKTHLQTLNEAVANAERAVKLATTTEGEEAAQKTLNSAKTTELSGAVHEYTQAVSESKSAVTEQEQVTRNATAAFAQAQVNLMAYQERIKEHGTETKADKAELDKLNAAVKEAKEADDRATEALEKKSAALKTSTNDLAAAKKAQQDYVDTTAEANAKASRDLEEFFAKEKRRSKKN